MMSNMKFDFVVIGAGIVGSWTARELKKHGKVLLLEQFREPHTRGSSHGQSRLIRSSYEEPFFADMMPHAFKMWREAETEMKEKLIETTGALIISKSKKDESFLQCMNNLKRLSPENFVELTTDDMKSKYSSKLKYSEDNGVFLDKSGGVIFAHKAVRTIQKWFQNSGGIFWDCSKVTEIVPSESKIKIVTKTGDVTAKSLVVCAGPWTKDVLGSLAPPLPLQPKAIKVYYWKEKELGAYSAASGFPALLKTDPPFIYALPSLEYPGFFKVNIHDGVPCIPEERDKAPVSKELKDTVKNYIKEHLPLVEDEPSIIETCMYTCTPDEIFIIDTLPGHKNIAIGAGFSGTGFKTSPVVGRLLSELARGVDPFLDLTPYRMSRFSSSDKPE